MTEWIITSSVLILTIFALRFLLRGKISLKLQYALWLLVAMRLLLPFSLFESPASVMNAVPEPPKTVYSGAAPETEYNMPADFAPASPFAPSGDAAAEADVNISYSDGVTEPTAFEFDWNEAAKAVWLLGIAVTATIFLVSNLRFSAALLRSRQRIEAEGCALPVYVSGSVKTPCLFGLFRPSVYLTKEVLCDEHVLRHVLAHESTHFSHRDHIWALLRCACVAIHWYNPLVWLAAFFSLRDAELACDEDTIKKIGENERAEYGRTLIGLACGRPAAGILHTATTMTGSKSGIKERIALIAKRPKMLRWAVVMVVLITVLAAACTFTGANTRTNAGEVTELTAEQIDEVNAAFAPETTDENGIPMATPISCFFTSYYTEPQDIDLTEFLRCCPNAGKVSSQAELDELRKSEYYPLGSVPLGAADRPVNKFTASSVNLLLQQYTGVGLGELIDAGKSSEELIYVEKYDSYYSFFAKDLYPGTFNCTRGEIEGDEIRLYSDLSDGSTALLTLRKEGENYFIASHVLMGVTADRSAENKEATEVLENVDPLTEKYYNYFGSELLYIMNEDPHDQSKIGFTDEQISVFAYLTALRENPGYDSAAGVPRDYFDEICEKHFGRKAAALNLSMLKVLENGNIASTGWNPSGVAYVLNSVHELDGKVKKAAFFEIPLGAAEVEAFYEKYPDGNLSFALLEGQFDDFGEVSLVELRFIEHMDENGNFYVEYISANRLGTTKNTGVYHSVPSDPLFEAEIPDLTGSSRSWPSLREEELSAWCVNGGEKELISLNYSENYENILGGTDPARLIYNVTDNRCAAISQRSFSSLSNADYEYLLYTALFRTPAVYSDNENINGSALEKISDAFEGWVVSDFVYGSDVEKTFRYLFGDEVEYVPKNLREFGWRYIEEADVYIRLEHQGLSLDSAGYPLVVNVRQNGDLCEIDAFLGFISPGDESIAFYSGTREIEYSKDNLTGLYLSQKLYTYAFRRAGDGRFVLQSVYAKAP